ncbi:sigma-54-dependent Fis family transcriptional regulator [Alkalilimnicola ehrlichii]|uniref:Sigma-54-dependent Fis family transcriptional regulator n=1 Tax=Alkalilimnicola ehrlichii TaxID=351052 RepID=A0A3E0WR30_9GAMM|nr:sigma 54-interacting transcriptional regulator [Alkalilimnicola ehrlichii]RFA24748.1 sigma-54-dependent Fis family transcriptional regulator [Alkalilimnicola ehrlichii]RFA35420.1 sigma-54-dependent Fis family transcriptional regulator [Alkalilimnicola ehrlichii]
MEPVFSNNNANGLTTEIVDTLIPLFEETSAGAIAVDCEARITWINRFYAHVLGVSDPAALIGKPIIEIIPASRMHEVVRTGVPILLDIMELRDLHLVVTRLPVHDARGEVTGAVAFVLFDDLQPLTPLIAKYRRLQQELSAARRALARRTTRYDLSDFVGASPGALEVKRRARLAARRNVPVLLLGETGTGKEVLAQAIHAASPRADRPFVGVNVAAVPENLLEAEFFGVSPGAYTGADKRTREGKFQLADGGTLFLDEVGDMPLPLQAKILRALQEREVEPLGSNAVKAVDVRVIAATSRDLDAMVAEGSFRSDLYYRLNVLQIHVPPLRERLNDIGVLCEALLEELAAGGEIRADITPEALQLLSRHHWPGNVRELRNVLEQAITLAEDPSYIDIADLLPVLPNNTWHSERPVIIENGIQPLSAVLAEAEQAAIHNALRLTGGNKSQAARLLGISRSVLYEKLRKVSETPDICLE